ncbi:YciI family protein [Aquimarina sediminis]|uniref:YciI family protein n=1 Tax=Aquimarina sediminis TaxID=2070536 RepID=UPI000CA0615C|nr:YciI family protein [Aquimarina sediminis]
MFIINFNFIKPIEEVNRFTEAHRNYILTQYKAEKFVLGGPKSPRNGGVIIANCDSEEEVHKILSKDPLIQKEIAEYSLIEFKPLLSVVGLGHYIK